MYYKLLVFPLSDGVEVAARGTEGLARFRRMGSSSCSHLLSPVPGRGGLWDFLPQQQTHGQDFKSHHNYSKFPLSNKTYKETLQRG